MRFYAESHAYGELIGEVEPLDGAREFLDGLKDLGFTVVLASSAKEDELDHYLDLLEARDVVDAGQAPPTCTKRSQTPISCKRQSRRQAVDRV